MNDYYVYVYFRPDTGEPCYIGKGRGGRWMKHIWGRGTQANLHLRNIIASAGHDIPRLKLRENLSEEEALHTEVQLITAIGREPNGPLVNLTDGGEGLKNISPETREKMRLAKLGKPSSKRGVPLSDVTKQKLRVANLGKKNGPPSQEKVAKLRESSVRHFADPAVRQQLSQRTKQQMADQAARDNLSAKMMGNTNGAGYAKGSERNTKAWTTRRARYGALGHK